ncbi:MAG TPA: hypothetical protein VN030_13585, partial [Cellvibrio sp.]|nr:hypothetical protein [Cellvibrio sp.]
NEFSELDYKLSHEQGLRKSPLIPYKKPMFPQKNRECLLFLNAYEANIWHRTYGVRGGDEGIESEKIIIKILSNN